MARDAETGRIVEAKELIRRLSIEEIRRKQRRGDFSCPRCGATFIFKYGRVKRPHFAHESGFCRYYSEPETEEHAMMKDTVYESFRRRGLRVEYEVGVGDNVADVYIHDLGVAVEVQYSNIPLRDFIRRMNEYSRNKTHVLWLLHPRHIEWRKWFIVRARFKRFLIFLGKGQLYFLDPVTKNIGIYVLRKRKLGLEGYRYGIKVRWWDKIYKYGIRKYIVNGYYMASPWRIEQTSNIAELLATLSSK